MKRFLKTVCRVMAGLSVTLLSSAGASVGAWAHEIGITHSKWYPPAPKIDTGSGHIVTPFCDGKYEDVASGLHGFSLTDSIHFYRLNSGLPKLTALNKGVFYGYHTRRETRLRDALRLLDRAQSHLSPAAIGDYIMTLNVNLHGGKDPDWWLKEDETANEPNKPNKTKDQNKELDRQQGCSIFWRWSGESQFCRPGYRSSTRAIARPSVAAAIARENTAFDWLMAGHQLDNARANWLGYAALNKDAVAHIFDHIDQQSLKRPGVNIWMARYQHHKLFDHTLPPDIAQRAQTTVSRVISCQATPAEYGIMAVGDLGLPRDYLPKGLAQTRIRRDIHKLTYKAISEGNGLDTAYHYQLRALVEPLTDKSWATHYLFLSAPDIATAMEIYQNSLAEKDQDIYRFASYYGRVPTGVENLIFGLPTEAIPHKLMQFGHALSENNLALVASLEDEAFAGVRVIRQSKVAAAQNQLDRSLKYYKSDHSQTHQARGRLKIATAAAAEFDRIKNADLPIQVRASLLAIMAEVSHNEDRHNRKKTRNIHPEQSRSDFLDVYVRHKLFPGIIHTPRVRGYPSHRSPYLYLKNNYAPGATDLPPLRKNDGTPEVGFAALVDWDKLDAFAEDQKLTRVIAVHLMNWIDAATPEDRRAHADLMAPALYDILRIARFEEAGIYKGAPVQKRVHEYLHKYYGQTDSAKRSPYWWPSIRRGHVPF